MTEKSKILDRLGEDDLLLTKKLDAALVANDRVKYLFSLLQAAVTRAQHPDRPFNDLSVERAAADFPDAAFDHVIENSRKTDGNACQIPQAANILSAIGRQIDDMISPFDISGAGNLLSDEERGEAYRKRAQALLADFPAATDDTIPAQFVTDLTSADRKGGDTLHILVMDMHKALNHLQQAVAAETVDGASVFNVNDDDKRLIRAFMSGVGRTSPLRFGHPGLDTTATRSGKRLLIQNDIGTTDAHVLVVSVEGLKATVTYTDIHPERLQFFMRMLSPFEVAWSNDNATGVEGFEQTSYQLGTGVFEAPNTEELGRYLAHLGSRLVYLIDWNKARKRLRAFVRNKKAIGILEWAARNDYGHRGFLVLGGEHLIYESIEYAAGPEVHYGERLEDMLGEDRAVEYLCHVLRTATEGLLHGRSERIVKDEIKAALLGYFQSAREGLFTIAGDHAAYIYELAASLNTALQDHDLGNASERLRRLSERARAWEKQADDIMNDGRALSRRIKGGSAMPMILNHADDAADDLEEAIFVLTLLPEAAPAQELIPPLKQLSGTVLASAKEFVRCVSSAASVHRGGASEDTADFLEAVDRIVSAEHRADDVARQVTTALVKHSNDCAANHVVSELTRTIESATDALAQSAHALRTHILEEVLNQ